LTILNKQKFNENQKENKKNEIIDVSDEPTKEDSTFQIIPSQPKSFKGVSNNLYEISSSSLELLDSPKSKSQTESWLNDEIINAYIELVKARHESPNPPSTDKLVFFNTYNYAKLEQLLNENNIPQFDRILKRKKIGAISRYDRLFFPINFKQYHWLLVVVNLAMSKFEFYDSIENQSAVKKYEILAPILQFVKYRIEKENDPLVIEKDVDKWPVEIMK